MDLKVDFNDFFIYLSAVIFLQIVNLETIPVKMAATVKLI